MTIPTTNPTRIGKRSSGNHVWDVVEVARFAVQTLRYGNWLMVGEYFDTIEAAEADAALMTTCFRVPADEVRVTTGGWVALRHPTDADRIAHRLPTMAAY